MKKTLIELVSAACAGFKLMHFFFVEFISGMKLGIEFYLGEDLDGGDKFAMTLDLFILRFTYVVSDATI